MTTESPKNVIVNGFGSLTKLGGRDDTLAKVTSSSLLHWYCAPDSWVVNVKKSSSLDDSINLTQEETNKREGKDGSWSIDERSNALVISPPAKKDFWRKTYYEPVLVKDDGPCLFATIPFTKVPITIETSFTLIPKRQFDQAGLCVRIDSEHWMKTGIEVVDGRPRLSCVVTNVYSDWSTQPWNECRAKIRVHVRHNGSFVVEAAPVVRSDDDDDDDDGWEFVRIAHLSKGMKCDDDALVDHIAVQTAWEGEAAPQGYLYAGVFACCPEDQGGCTATFHNFSIVEGSTFDHNADGNHE